MTGRCASPARAFHQATVETAATKEVSTMAGRITAGGGRNERTPLALVPFRDRLGCSPGEACAALGVGRTFFYQLIARRQIEVRKLGRRTIVSVPSLIRLMDGQPAESKPRRRG